MYIFGIISFVLLIIYGYCYYIFNNFIIKFRFFALATMTGIKRRSSDTINDIFSSIFSANSHIYSGSCYPEKLRLLFCKLFTFAVNGKRIFFLV